MRFVRRSPLTNKINVREIDVTPDEWFLYLSGALVQDAMPNVSADDREFILNGMTVEDSARLALWAEQSREDT